MYISVNNVWFLRHSRIAISPGPSVSSPLHVRSPLPQCKSIGLGWHQACFPSQVLCICVVFLLTIWLRHEKWVVWNEDISPLMSTFAKRYVKDVRQGLWATFQWSIFYPLIGLAINIRPTGPSHCYKAYLQPSWIISSLEDDIWLSLPSGTGETKWGQS